jgi:hypothetical protein
MVCIEISSAPSAQSADISGAIQNAFDFSSLMSIITAYQTAQATADGFQHCDGF